MGRILRENGKRASGFAIDDMSFNGASPVIFAARAPSNHRTAGLQILELFRKHNADLSATDSTWNRNALHWAVVNVDGAMIRWLVQCTDVDLTKQDGKGLTAQQLAQKMEESQGIVWGKGLFDRPTYQVVSLVTR